MGYGDYLEQLTYLLFLKLADEFSKPPYNRKLPIPTENNWGSLTSKRGDDLELHYSKTLSVLSRQKGVLGLIIQTQILKDGGENLPMMKSSTVTKLPLTSPWIKDKSLADLDNLSDPDVLAGEIIENLEAGLESFREIMITLNGKE